MDPIGAGASIYTIVQAVACLGKFIHKVQKDVRHAPIETEEARNHVLLLQKEIEGVRNLKTMLDSGEDNPFSIAKSPLTQAIETAEKLLSDVEQAFPINSKPDTLKQRLRWALKDKETVAKLEAKLKDAESTLQTILQVEQK
jgi:hypothetical protein